MLGNTIIARKGTTNAANVPQFISSGFVPNAIPPVPPLSARTSLLQLGVVKTLITGADTGFDSNIFALPVRSTHLTWQCSGNTVTEVNLLGSLDGTTFFTIDSMTSVGVKTIQREGVPFIQVEVVDGLDVTVKLITKARGFKR